MKKLTKRQSEIVDAMNNGFIAFINPHNIMLTCGYITEYVQRRVFEKMETDGIVYLSHGGSLQYELNDEYLKNHKTII